MPSNSMPILKPLERYPSRPSMVVVLPREAAAQPSQRLADAVNPEVFIGGLDRRQAHVCEVQLNGKSLIPLL